MIDTKRRTAITVILARLDAQVHYYRSTSYSCPQDRECSFQCGCMLLGALMRGLDSVGLPSLQLGRPVSGHGVDVLCKKITSMKSEQWHHRSDRPESIYGGGYSVKTITDLSFVDVGGLSLQPS
jgi:hypothetical protein